jgi:hypothetical protein
VNYLYVDTLMRAYPFMNWRLRQGSASAAHTSGLLVTAQAGQWHWWIDVVFAVPSGGRSIHGNSSRPGHCTMNAAPCVASPKT